MLNKFLKTFFFTSIAVAALVAFISTANFSVHWFTNMLVGITYKGGSYHEISAAVTAFFPTAITILSILLSLAISVTIHFIQKKKAADTNPKVSRFFLFYFISLIVVSLLVLLSCAIRFNISERYIWADDAFVIILLYGACIAEALVLAALLVGFFTLWKTNKLAASIIGALILFMIPANIVSGFAVYEASSTSSSSYSYSSSDYSYSNNSTTDTHYYTQEDEYEIFEVEEDYLSFLWDENNDVNAALAHLFQNNLSSWDNDHPHYLIVDMDFELYGINTDDEEWDKYLSEPEKISEGTLRKMYYYLKENPSEILRSFNSYQNVIYQYVPVYKFYGTGAYTLLQQLTVAHNDLYSDDDFTRLQNIYKLMSNIEHDRASEYYNDIKLHINDGYLSSFYDEDEDYQRSGIVWAYSFWARRHAEGTDDIAYSILTRLNEHYSDAEYYQNYDYEDEGDYYEEEDYETDEDNSEYESD